MFLEASDLLIRRKPSETRLNDLVQNPGTSDMLVAGPIIRDAVQPECNFNGLQKSRCIEREGLRQRPVDVEQKQPSYIHVPDAITAFLGTTTTPSRM